MLCRASFRPERNTGKVCFAGQLTYVRIASEASGATMLFDTAAPWAGGDRPAGAGGGESPGITSGGGEGAPGGSGAGGRGGSVGCSKRKLGRLPCSCPSSIYHLAAEQGLPCIACLGGAVGEGSPVAREPVQAPVHALQPWRRRGCRPRIRRPRGPPRQRWRLQCRAACRRPPPARTQLRKGQPPFYDWQRLTIIILKRSSSLQGQI